MNLTADISLYTSFADINQASGDFYSFPFNGIIGLGPNQQAQLDSFINTLYYQDFIPFQQFGYFMDWNNVMNLYIGDVDPLFIN